MEEFQKTYMIYQKLKTGRRVKGPCHRKPACILVFVFSPMVRFSLVKMQKLCFTFFLFLSFAVLHPA